MDSQEKRWVCILRWWRFHQNKKPHGSIHVIIILFSFYFFYYIDFLFRPRVFFFSINFYIFYRSPVFAGGIFMISREWFFKLNGFNPLIKVCMKGMLFLWFHGHWEDFPVVLLFRSSANPSCFVLRINHHCNCLIILIAAL